MEKWTMNDDELELFDSYMDSLNEMFVYAAENDRIDVFRNALSAILLIATCERHADHLPSNSQIRGNQFAENVLRYADKQLQHLIETGNFPQE